MVDDEGVRSGTLASLTQRVRSAILQGCYDVAINASSEAVAALATDASEAEAADLAAEAWMIHGEALELNDRLGEALLARERGIRIARRRGWAPPVVATALAQAGQNLRLLDRNGEAADRLEAGRALLAASTGTEVGRDAIRAKCLLDALEADLLCDADEGARATTLKAEALAGWRELYPEAEYPVGHPDLANAITDCGWVAGETNEDAAMARWYEEAMTAQERLHPSDTHPLGHPDLANAYNNIAFARMQLGFYVDAEVFYGKAVRMREGLYPPARFPDGRAEMAVSHMNLGELLMRRGDLVRAEQQYRRALAIRERAFPVEAYPNGHTDLLRTLMSVAKLRVEGDDTGAAIPYYERAWGMARRLYPEAGERSGHAVMAWVLHDYGRALMLGARDDLAFEVLQQAEKVFALGATANFLHASTLAALGELAARRGGRGECEAYCERARCMYEAAYPNSSYETGHSNLATGLARLARVALLVGDDASARRLVMRSRSIFRRIAEDFFLDSALIEGLLLRAQFTRLPALFLSVDDVKNPTEAHDTVFEMKGAVRRIQTLRAAHLRTARDPSIVDAGMRLRRLRADLSRLFFLPYDRRYASPRREAFRRLVDSKELLEQQVARAIRPELEAAARRVADAAGFRRRIPPDAVLVDVIRYARTSVSSRGGRVDLVETEEYLAFVVDSGGVLARVDLGLAVELDALVERWRRDIERRADGPAREAASRRIWKPIGAVLPSGKAKILISPDGALHRLPWLALDDDLGRPLLETHLVVLKADAWSDAWGPSGGGAADEGATLVVGDVAHSLHPGELERRRPAWLDLPHGRREIEGVISASGPSTVLTRDRATTEAVLAAIGGKRVIHVATHGFYVDPATKEGFDLDPELVDPLSGLSDRHRRSARRHSPLLSGLILAGANDWPALDADGLPRGDRSVLTAEEISGADGRDADLVVLAACETNLGDHIHGDGVLGIRAAFHEAGAQCVISSLWRVDDAATSDLMVDLHRDLRNGDLRAPEALRRAQLAMLQRRQRDDGGRCETHEWAGFVPSVSSWESLESLACPRVE